MSAIDALMGTTAGSSTDPEQKTTSSRTNLGRDDFYKIMVSELSNQDPFEPLDNQQFLAQLSSLQNLDTMAQLNEGIGKLLLSGEISAAGTLIGREVHAVDPEASEGAGDLSGTVERVQVKGGEVSLVLDGDRTVSLGDLVEIA